ENCNRCLKSISVLIFQITVQFILAGRRNMSTISDVARLAGLSRATVSRVINNHPYVSEEKRESVLKAMRDLGYIPNSAAQNLRKQKTNIIAVLVPRLTNPFFAYLVDSIEAKAAENGLQILICNTKYSKKRELGFLRY